MDSNTWSEYRGLLYCHSRPASCSGCSGSSFMPCSTLQHLPPDCVKAAGSERYVNMQVHCRPVECTKWILGMVRSLSSRSRRPLFALALLALLRALILPGYQK